MGASSPVAIAFPMNAFPFPPSRITCILPVQRYSINAIFIQISCPHENLQRRALNPNWGAALRTDKKRQMHLWTNQQNKVLVEK
jgi:hypothetical protein